MSVLINMEAGNAHGEELNRAGPNFPCGRLRSLNPVFSVFGRSSKRLWESFNLSNFTDVRIERVASTPPNM